MAIPRRFSMTNPAGDELRAKIAALPAADRAAAEAVLPGVGHVSLALPDNQQSVQQNQFAQQPGSAQGILDRLKLFATATKATGSQDEQLFISRGLISCGNGYTVITVKGIGYLVDFGLL